MRAKNRILIALLPLAITLGGWQFSLWLNDLLGCQSVGKDPQPCIVLGANIQGPLAFTSWWGMLLWVPGLIISGLLLGKVLSTKVTKPWGSRNAQ
jgi:hypothetical protein